MPLEDEIYKSKKSETYVFFIYHCFFITPELKYKNLELIALERLKQNDKINPLTSMSKITNLKTLNLASEGLVKIKIKGTFLKDAYVLVVGSLRFIDSAVVKELINRGGNYNLRRQKVIKIKLRLKSKNQFLLDLIFIMKIMETRDQKSPKTVIL